MSKNDLNEEIDHLAVKIEQKIEEGRKFLNELPDFAPRSNRSKRMRKRIKNK